MNSELIPTGPIPNSKCPKCAASLKVVTKQNPDPYAKHKQFVGCMSYPRCRYVTTVTPEIAAVMIEQAEEFAALPAEF